MPRRQKKNLGRGKQVRREKWDLRGQQSAPSPTEKVPDARRPWVPGPTGNKRCRQNPKKGASIAPAHEALPLALTPARGWGDPLCPLRCDHLLGFARKSVAAKQKKGKKKTRQKKNKKTLAASRPKKRASEGASEQAQAP